MKRMTTRDYHEMLHFAPQKAEESRFARDYRSQHAPKEPPSSLALDAMRAVGLIAFAYLIWTAFAVLA